MLQTSKGTVRDVWARSMPSLVCFLLAIVSGGLCLLRPADPLGLFAAGILALALTTLGVSLARTIRAKRRHVTKAQLQQAVAQEQAARVRAEGRLREMERKYRSIFDHATDVITHVSKSGRMLDVNARVEEVFGYKPEEIIGKHFIRLGILRVRDLPRAVKLFRETLRAGKADQFVELELKHRNGHSVFVEVGTQFITSNGKVEGVVNIFRDITERKRVLDELATAKREAEAANRAKSEFLANMSHEIRTPMTAILGFADVLADGLSDPDNLNAAKTIRRNGEYLLSILNDILDLSKIEAGKLQVERVACSPVEIVDEVVSLMRVRAAAKNLTLTAEYQGPIPQVILSDPVRVRQVLINLVGNGIKFTEIGGVRLVTSLLQDDESHPRLRFDVIDTGIGVGKDQVVRLFQPFRQVHRTATKGPCGTGLGLTITKRLVKMLGGKVWVRSVPGIGSTFTATVETGPLGGVQMLCPGKATTMELSNTRSKPLSQEPLNARVLLAEDGPDNVRLLSFLLRKWGAEVEVVENGLLAAEAALTARNADRAFGVILMDMEMPVMDGYEATRRLRSVGYREPIIALTAHAMKQDRQRCLDAGCDDYLAKPVDRERLLAAVAEYVARAQTISSRSGQMEGSALL